MSHIRPTPALLSLLAVAGVTLPAQSVSLVAVDAERELLLDVDPKTGSAQALGSTGSFISALAWDQANSVLYGASIVPDSLVRIDPATGKVTTVGSFGTSQHTIQGLAYNARNQTLYGAGMAAGFRQLFSINTTTGAASAIGPHGLIALGDLAYDSIADKLYASDVQTKELFTLDMRTGQATRIGPFNVGHAVGTGLAWHPLAGLFASDNGGTPLPDDYLYRVDTATGNATLIGRIGSANALGLAFVDGACLPATSRAFGVGLPGSSGFPTLTSTAPKIGTVMSLNMGNPRGAQTAALVLLYFASASIPVFWGGTLYVEPANAVLLGMSLPAGGLAQPVPIPANAPCGVSVFGQLLLADPTSTAGVANSAGLEMRIGN